MDFLGIGSLEFILIVVVFFVVVGPDKLPVYGRKMGEFIAKARRTVNEAKSAVTDEIGDIDGSGKKVAQDVKKAIDLPPSPDFDLHFNFDSAPTTPEAKDGPTSQSKGAH